MSTNMPVVDHRCLVANGLRGSCVFPPANKLAFLPRPSDAMNRSSMACLLAVCVELMTMCTQHGADRDRGRHDGTVVRM